MKKQKKMGIWMLLLPIYLFTFIFVFFPLIYMVLISFMQRGEVWGFDWSVTLENYRRILEPMYLRTFIQSLRLACIVTFFIALIGYPFGYAMARLSDTWKKRVMILLLIPFFTSALIRLNGWIIVFRSNGVLDQVLMGIGITEKPLKLLYSYTSVVVGMIYILLPFMILSVYASAEKLDWSYMEAARDLGASKFHAFITIALKLTLPGLLSGVVLTFIPSMGLFFIADLLGGNKIVLVGSLIQEQLTKGRNIPFAAALSVLLMILTSLILKLYRLLANTRDLEAMF